MIIVVLFKKGYALKNHAIQTASARGQITLRGAEVSSSAHTEPGSHFIFTHHHTGLLLRVGGCWGVERSTEAWRKGPTPTVGAKGLFCFVFFFLPTVIFPSPRFTDNHQQHWLVSQPRAWMWPLEEKRLLPRLFCTDAEVSLKFWSLRSLMFHLCLILILWSWEINGSERLHSFHRLSRRGRYYRSEQPPSSP